jgi:hypothetical protein
MRYSEKIFYPDYQQKKLRSKEIEAHVQDFLKKGGVIKKLLPEASALCENKGFRSRKII